MPRQGHSDPVVYQIIVQGKLDEEWSAWLNGMSVTLVNEHPPVTLIAGAVIDQAKLRGIINKLWDLNLTLISVGRICDQDFSDEKCRKEKDEHR